MVLIFGGAYQGKLEYAMDRFGLTDSDVYSCCDQSTEIPAGKKVIDKLDKWILALISSGADVGESAQRFIEQNADGIVICNDISCGVVPVEPHLRAWREAVGRTLAGLTRQSDEVVRVFCGIPTRLK